MNEREADDLERSAFERGKEAGEQGLTAVGDNPYETGSADHHHFESGRTFASKRSRNSSSSFWRKKA